MTGFKSYYFLIIRTKHSGYGSNVVRARVAPPLAHRRPSLNFYLYHCCFFELDLLEARELLEIENDVSHDATKKELADVVYTVVAAALGVLCGGLSNEKLGHHERKTTIMIFRFLLLENTADGRGTHSGGETEVR